MGVDAIAVLRPKSSRKLRKHVDPDDPEVLLVPLDDGTLLFHSPLSYDDAEREPQRIRAWLETTFGEDLAEAHDDPRGVLVFPDVCEPSAQSYDEVVEELAATSVWVALSDDERALEQFAAAQSKSKLVREERERLMGGVIVGFQMLGSPAPAGFESPMTREDYATLVAPVVGKGATSDVACVLVQRKTKLKERAGVTDLLVLPDGSTIVGLMSLKLARRSKSYAAALKSLGDAVTFVAPKGVEQLDAERRAKVRALFHSNDVAVPKKKRATRKP